MDPNASLSERKKQILKAVVDVHIRLGEPVGSKFLTQNEQIALSSATIRNEMAELEEMGYLEQPHTSAGRIPSGAGYRLYVDSLMNRYPISVSESRELEGIAGGRDDALDKMLERAVKMLSALTGYTAFAAKPGGNAVTVRRFDAVLTSQRSFILVMTLDEDNVQSGNVRTPIDITEEDLRRLMRTLNENIAGIPMERINLPCMIRMESDMGDRSALISPVIKRVYETAGAATEGELHFEGLNLLLQYPEFSDVKRMRELLEALEQKEPLLEAIFRSDPGRVNVIIGSETAMHLVNHAAMVFKLLTEEGRVTAAIGVIGPSRMDYAKAVSLLDHLTLKMSAFMHTEPYLLGGPGDPAEPGIR